MSLGLAKFHCRREPSSNPSADLRSVEFADSLHPHVRTSIYHTLTTLCAKSQGGYTIRNDRRLSVRIVERGRARTVVYGENKKHGAKSWSYTKPNFLDPSPEVGRMRALGEGGTRPGKSDGGSAFSSPAGKSAKIGSPETPSLGSRFSF